MNRWVMAALGTAAVAGTGYFVLTPSAEDRFVRACTDVLADRLVAPATLAIVGYTRPQARKPTQYEYLGWDLAPEEAKVPTTKIAQEARLAMLEVANLPDARITETIITYDAANRMGTPLRGHANCRSTSWIPGEAFDGYRTLSVLVDGRSSLAWSVFMLQKSQE